MAKLTKKMFADLEKAELREIIVIGMELEPRKAYRLDAAASIKWIQERASDFADVDLASLGTDCFRDGVVDYLTKLQSYILGNSPAPKFPTDGPADVEEVVEAKAVVEEVAAEPPKPKRGRPKKTQETSEAPTTTVKRGRGRPKKSETVKLEKPNPPRFKVRKKAVQPDEVEDTPQVTEEPLTPKSLGLVKEEIETTSTANVAVNLATDMETFASFQASVDALRSEVQALRTEQTASFNLISDALVYILNNAIIEDDEDVIKDLSQIKK